jgi:hypothetical protein
MSSTSDTFLLIIRLLQRENRFVFFFKIVFLSTGGRLLQWSFERRAWEVLVQMQMGACSFFSPAALLLFVLVWFFLFFFPLDFAVLSDKLVLKVFGEIDRCKDLLWVNMTSKAFYIFSRQDKLWRVMCFKRYKGDFVFKRNWRYTTLLPNRLELQEDEYPPDLKIEGFVSELLYRRWYIGHCDMKQFDMQFAGHLEKLDDISVADFEKNYLRIGKPAILLNATKDWTALDWTPEKLLEKYGDCKFRLNWGSYDAEKGKTKRVYVTMRDFWTYAKQQHDTEPGYIFDGAFWKKDRVPGMVDEFHRTKYFREDLFSVLGDEHRPDYRWFLCGPAGSGSPWHTDPHATSAWNGLLYGRKRWALYPPGKIPPGVTISDDGDEYHSIKPVRWFLEVYPYLKPEDKPMEFVLEPGEIVFVPAGWWHTVLNVTDTIAVTQNWIDRFNFHVAWTGKEQQDFLIVLFFCFDRYSELRRVFERCL